MNKSTLYSSIFIIAFGSICFFFFKSTVPTLEKESEKICNLYNDANQSIESLNFTLDSLKASDSIKFSGVELPATKELHLFDSNFKDEYCSLISVANRLKKINSRYDDKLFVLELFNSCGISNENNNEEIITEKLLDIYSFSIDFDTDENPCEE